MNLLFIMSDQHSNKILSCHGHPIIKTPNLDHLAEKGTRFTDAYSQSPICVPARATLATGLYVFENKYWCNAHSYTGAFSRFSGAVARDVGLLQLKQGFSRNCLGEPGELYS